MLNIEGLTINNIHDYLINKKISVKELVEEYLKRIELIDRNNYNLNSILELNPDVLKLADNLDHNYGKYTSKLFGVPVLLKDNIDTADKMHTSAGSLALAKSIATGDADIVTNLRQKGAIILGKTNMTEFANYMTKGMKAGYSSRGGFVKSPYGLEKDPSGSSTGAAVAVTANLCAVSIGTDTAGSIVSPGIANSIVGFRPSTGMLSQKGIIPICFTLDTAGPMTRNVMDAAILYSELINKKFTTNLESFKNVLIGIDVASMENMTTEEEKKKDNILKDLMKSGGTFKNVKIPKIAKDKLKEIQRYEFKYSINQYLSNLPKDYPIKSLKDIIKYNNEHEKETLKYGQSLLIDAEKNTSGKLMELNYIKALEARKEMRKQLDNIFKEFEVCIMFKNNLILQYAGLPVLTIPHGLYNNGTPYGIYLTASNDMTLLKCALLIEKMIGYRIVP